MRKIADPAASAQGVWTTPRGLCFTLGRAFSGQQRPSTAIVFSEIPGNPLKSTGGADYARFPPSESFARGRLGASGAGEFSTNWPTAVSDVGLGGGCLEPASPAQ